MNVMNIVEKRKVAEVLAKERQIQFNKDRASLLLANMKKNLEKNQSSVSSVKKTIVI